MALRYISLEGLNRINQIVLKAFVDDEPMATVPTVTMLALLEYVYEIQGLTPSLYEEK